MLITEQSADYRIVAQTEHANQVGRMASHWDEAAFGVPRPTAPVVAAAYLHDNGWWDWDLSPHLGDGGPINLFDVPAEQWAAFYRRGIDNAVEVDPYAGLLVSMHGAGVRRQRYGTDRSIPSYERQYAAFVEDQQRLQRELVDELRGSDRYGDHVDRETRRFLTELHDNGDPGEFEGDPPRLWTQYKLLQAWDRLSLYCCLNDRPSSERIHPVPSESGSDVELVLTPVDDTTVRVDPYPFDSAPLTVPVRGRVIGKDEYGSETDLVAAYYTADQQLFPFEFVRE